VEPVDGCGKVANPVRPAHETRSRGVDDRGCVAASECDPDGGVFEAIKGRARDSREVDRYRCIRGGLLPPTEVERRIRSIIPKAVEASRSLGGFP
jgi:hypothetical protein